MRTRTTRHRPGRWHAPAGSVALAVALLAAPLPASAAPMRATSPAWCPTGGVLAVEHLPRVISPKTCDLPGRIIKGRYASAAVPPVGTSVGTEVLLAGGGEAVLYVSTAADGTVTVATDAPSAGGGAATAASTASTTDACGDTAYTREPWKWTTNGTYTWYYNPTHETDGGLSSADALAGTRTATTDIVAGFNDCGYTAKPNIHESYLGTTTRKPAVTSSGTCGNTDGYSVTGWGPLDDPFLAVTCTWYTNNGLATESDMTANDLQTWWNGSDDCSWSYDLESVVTHERGHTFGLDHVDGDVDAEQTMTPTIPGCDTSKRTLGAGDYRGLAAIYGTH